MKKFLSLVLALVMTMSLVTISAGAKDFTDDSKITYSEAVDVVSACKVLDGYADGSFNPTATLTRGAAAKIICNLILGPTTASALAADAAPFKDVSADNVFAGYIAYCAKQGIISGYADGTFRPTGTLTGYAFMKMLLGALGYDATLEGYTGNNWSVNVAKQAIAIGLDDGNDEFSGVKAVTREEAALYAFNTLKADIVEYKDKGTNITIGDTTINTGASKAEFVLQNGSGYSNNMNESPNDSGKQTVQFAEKYFKKLVHTTPGTAFGDPSNQWVYDGQKVGNYAKTPKLTYTKKVKAKDIYADLGLSADPTVTYYVDGVPTTPISIDKTTTTKYGDKGTLTSVYYTSSSNSVIVVEKNVYLGKVTSIDEATKTTKRTINISGIGTPSGDIVAAGASKFETEEFARKDYVQFTAAASYTGTLANNNVTVTGYEVKSAKPVEIVSGQFTAYAGTSSVVVGGKTYDIGAKAGTNGATYTGSLKDTVDLYLDANGYVLEIKTSEAADASYAYVLDTQGDGTTFDPYEAQLLFLDGTTKVVKTKAASQAANNALKNDFVTFSINSDDKYVLTDATPGNITAAGWMKVINGNATMTINNNPFYGNDETIYVVKTTGASGDVYTVYTGYKNVPTLDDGNNGTVSVFCDVVCKAGTVANYVYVDATAGVTISGGTSNVIFVLGDKGADKYVNVDNNGYYVLDAVVNGEITKLNVDDSSASIALVTDDPLTKAGAIYTSSNTDKYGITTLNTLDVSGGYSIGIDEIEKGVVTFLNHNNGGSAATLALAKDCDVFYVNKDGKILAWDVESVAYDTNDVVYYTMDKGAVNNLFIVAK